MTKAMSAQTTPTTRRPRFESERHMPRKTQPSKARWIRGSAPLSAPHAPHAKYCTPGSRSVVPHRKQRRTHTPFTATDDGVPAAERRPPQPQPSSRSKADGVPEGRRLLELDANERWRGASANDGRGERGFISSSLPYLERSSVAVSAASSVEVNIFSRMRRMRSSIAPNENCGGGSRATEAAT